MAVALDGTYQHTRLVRGVDRFTLFWNGLRIIEVNTADGGHAHSNRTLIIVLRLHSI